MTKITEYTLVGVNGNAYSILGYVKQAMKQEGYSSEEISDYMDEATKIDYDNLVSKSIDKLHEINLKKRGEMSNGI